MQRVLTPVKLYSVKCELSSGQKLMLSTFSSKSVSPESLKILGENLREVASFLNGFPRSHLVTVFGVKRID